jgi:type VI secretion system protein ImpM
VSLRSRQPAGFFGKLPSRGDFVRGSLSRDVAEAWDRWLQAVLPAAIVRMEGEEEWQATWLSAPSWRFRLPSGMCGPLPLAGIWLPSRDRIGRPFPLIAAADGATAEEEHLDRLEAICRRAIDAMLSPDQLDAELGRAAQANLPPNRRSPPQSPNSAVWWRSDAAASTPALELQAMPGPDLLLRMLTAA